MNKHGKRENNTNKRSKTTRIKAHTSTRINIVSGSQRRQKKGKKHVALR